jgi:DNA-binding NarL/FixJ family response regulator
MSQVMALGKNQVVRDSFLVNVAGKGLNPSETAASLGISENTLKTHLKRIYAKTGTSRHADLLKLVSDIATPVQSKRCSRY